MSVAFTKEDSAETAAETQLPERPISDAHNLVTPEGLAALERQRDAARAAYEVAMQIEDINERRRQAASPYRDLRYYAERVRTAQLMPVPADQTVVAFGHRVSFVRDDGREQAFRIVGEDEADPKTGSISYLSPIASALMGKVVGEVVNAGALELEITAIA